MGERLVVPRPKRSARFFFAQFLRRPKGMDPPVQLREHFYLAYRHSDEKPNCLGYGGSALTLLPQAHPEDPLLAVKKNLTQLTNRYNKRKIYQEDATKTTRA